jgi:F-type H+-transporting ATPase subunit a
MNELGQITQIIIPVFGYNVTLNLEVVMMTWIVISILLLFGYFSARKRSIFAGPLQIVGEMIVSTFYGLAEDSLDKELAKKYAPMICALFMFVALSNWMGLIPFLEEPTKDLNTPLSLGIMGFVISHYAGIKTKGFKKYMSAYFEPWIIWMPFNIIGEIANVVSISFRLFGNIMGGAIIILVVSHLTYSVLLPPFLNLFFGLFVGSIQAFVFTMLTTVYISLQVK